MRLLTNPPYTSVYSTALIDRSVMLHDAQKTSDHYINKALVACIKQQAREHVKKINDVKQYEETLNNQRVVYCGCGTILMGSTASWDNNVTCLQREYGLYVYDPACSDLCREEYDYTCSECGSGKARLFGFGHNGDLHCLARCHMDDPATPGVTKGKRKREA